MTKKKPGRPWKKGANAGAENNRAKLTERDVRFIRDLRSRFRNVPKDHPASLAALAKLFGVTPITICRVATGYRWRHVR